MSRGLALENLSRHLAHISVLGRTFSECRLPLLPSLAPEHGHSLAALVMLLKCDCGDMSDVLNNADVNLTSIVQFFAQ
jgi:hypothetical protein